MDVRFKKLDENAVLPSRAHPTDAGLDLVATSQRVDTTHFFIEYGIGLAVEIPEGHVGYIFPRSSVSKTKLGLTNSVGVIDSSYRGEIKLRFYPKDDRRGSVYKIGDKIGQLIIMPILDIKPVFSDELSETDRGEGSFGSSGN